MRELSKGKWGNCVTLWSRQNHGWDNAHANKIGPVNAFEAFGNDRLDAQQCCAFGGPVTRRPCAILFSAAVKEHCRADWPFLPVGTMHLKGKNDNVDAFSLNYPGLV